MTGQYYGLVAGLPDIVLDSGSMILNSKEVISEFMERLIPADRSLFACVRYPFDNANLVNLMEKRGRLHDPRGNFTSDELNDLIKTLSGCPLYMENFLLSEKEGKVLFQGLSSENTLASLFFEEMTNHSNQFIRDWFSFELDLRNVLAALNIRKTKSDLNLENVLIGKNEVVEHVLRSSAPDFSLSSSRPWVEKIVSASEGVLLEREKLVDQLRWDEVDELTMLTHFQAETCFGFFIKYCLAERWLSLDPETGREMMDKLVNDLSSGLKIE